MELRPLGRTGLAVSALGLGTVKFGRNTAVKFPTAFALPDDAAIAALLDRAAALGITLLDTAPAYGESEARLGRALTGQRDRWVICSKAGERFHDNRSSFDFSEAAITASVEASLSRLATDRIDVLLLHSDGIDETAERFAPAVAALDRLKRQGMIRATGFSGKSAAGGLALLPMVDVVMVTCNPAWQDELPVIAAAGRLGKGVLVKKALASGWLDPGRPDPVQAALDFVFAQAGVSSVVIGTLDPEHLTANAAAVDRAIARSAS